MSLLLNLHNVGPLVTSICRNSSSKVRSILAMWRCSIEWCIMCIWTFLPPSWQVRSTSHSGQWYFKWWKQSLHRTTPNYPCAKIYSDSNHPHLNIPGSFQVHPFKECNPEFREGCKVLTSKIHQYLFLALLKVLVWSLTDINAIIQST